MCLWAGCRFRRFAGLKVTQAVTEATAAVDLLWVAMEEGGRREAEGGTERGCGEEQTTKDLVRVLFLFAHTHTHIHIHKIIHTHTQNHKHIHTR